MRSYPMILVSLELSGSRRFGRVEPPQTHVKLLCWPGSPYRFGRVDPKGKV